MPMPTGTNANARPESFTVPTLIKGRPTELHGLRINGQAYQISRGIVKTARLLEEWYEDVDHPDEIIAAMRRDRVADILTFVQRWPDVSPRYPFYREYEQWAVLPITTYDAWWNNDISGRTRGMLRKSQKSLDLRVVDWTDEFVNGITAIFNETPIRQGRPFWHYGKSADVVREQFSRYLFRETLIGAYVGDQLVGFIMLANAGRFALTGQILSLISHRDKSTNNALIAKAVEVCAERGIPALIYLHWGTGAFSEFKRRCGFQRTEVPRYYVPLTFKGRCALASRLHDGYRSLVPVSLQERVKDLRRAWYERGQA